MPAKIRIGAVDYLNTRPLVFGMQQGLGEDRVELSFAVPSALSEQMAAGELDVALLPVIELARSADLELVPGLGITTRGAARSVLLVGKRAVSEIESVALDPESRTSNVLAQVLLADVWERRPRAEQGHRDLDRSLARCDAAVRIGDKALFEPLPEELEVHDLGQAWTELTGLPFVFAAWVARPGVMDRELYTMLHESRRRGVRVMDTIAEDYTWNGAQYPEIARSYLFDDIHYRLGSDELRAMEIFFERARALGLIAEARPVRMAMQRRTACHDAAESRKPVAP